MIFCPLYTNISNTPRRCMHPYVTSGTLLHPFFLTRKINIYDGLFSILLYLLCAPVTLTSWMDLKLHSYAHLEVWYIFCRVPTSSWSLIKVWTFLHYLYTFQVKPSLYGNQSPASWTWLALSSDLQPGNYIVQTFITLIYLNLGFMC